MHLMTALLPVLMASEAPQFIAFDPSVSDEVAAVMKRRSELEPDAFIAELEKLADRGDVGALEYLGEIYEAGLLNRPKDEVKACDYFERVGNARADSLHNMATCFYNGRGRAENHAKARILYAQAAEAGWLMSYCARGNMLIKGQGGDVDVGRGLELCRFAADLGDKNAQTDLGGYLLMGKVTDRKPVEAREWLTRAANQEQGNASYLLGQIYEKGDGVGRDTTKSRDWYKIAHRLGRDDAPYRLMLSFLTDAASKRDGKTVIDPAYTPHILEWGRIAAQVDYNAERRKQAADIVAELES